MKLRSQVSGLGVVGVVMAGLVGAIGLLNGNRLAEAVEIAQGNQDLSARIEQQASAVAEQGGAVVGQVVRTMDEIVASIRRVTAIVGEITASSDGQATGISQVGDAVTQMDRSTQHSAALVEQIAAAASSLRGLAQGLVNAVAAFRLPRGPVATELREHAA